MRVALYLRVSSPRQKDGVSLDDQETICRAYAERMGWHVVAVYTEAGRSAFTERMEKRIAFQQMLSDAKARQFDFALVYKLNRFARKVLIQYQAAAELERCKVQIASATEPIDRKTASGRLTFGMLAVIAEAQSDQLSEKMRDTRAAEARAGRHVGPLATGYNRIGGTLVPNEKAEAARLAFALYATKKESYASVADALNAAGHTTGAGRPFSKFQVEEMLKNPVYVGRVRCQGQEYPGNHEGIIDAETWAIVQGEIARRGGGNHEQRGASRPAMLSGLARCSNCSAPMWYMPLRGSGRSHSYYVCSGRLTRSRSLRCNLPFVQAQTAERYLIDRLGILVGNSDLMAIVADELDALASAARGPAAPALDRVKLDARSRRLQRLYLDGMIGDEEYERELVQIRAQLSVLDAPTVQRAMPDVREAAAFLADIPGLLREAEPHDARAVVAEVFDVVYLMPHAVMAVRACEQLAPVLRELRLKCNLEWAGWAPGTTALQFNEFIVV